MDITCTTSQGPYADTGIPVCYFRPDSMVQGPRPRILMNTLNLFRYVTDKNHLHAVCARRRLIVLTTPGTSPTSGNITNRQVDADSRSEARRQMRELSVFFPTQSYLHGMAQVHGLEQM